MIQGLYAAATGLRALEQRQEISATNIANASTVGFRRQAPVQMGFYQLISQHPRSGAYFSSHAGPGGGAVLQGSTTIAESGNIVSTGDPFNVALVGPGFLVVNPPEGERYTRAGAFTMDIEGHLTTAEGFKVLGAAGDPIDVRGGSMEIDGQGRITIDGVPTGQLQLVEFEDPARLVPAGRNLLRVPEGQDLPTTAATTTTAQQKYLESSNVNVPQEMVEMMLGLRAYEANHRALLASDETLSRLIDQVAQPG
ncbi:MAG: flagellar hook-basal body protein [Candidatus Hydrogenedentes bacterium]|nr:flagellar hook-basal body protein [Candidatus Hydrogenedentota bacterium]